MAQHNGCAQLFFASLGYPDCAKFWQVEPLVETTLYTPLIVSTNLAVAQHMFCIESRALIKDLLSNVLNYGMTRGWEKVLAFVEQTKKPACPIVAAHKCYLQGTSSLCHSCHAVCVYFFSGTCE